MTASSKSRGRLAGCATAILVGLPVYVLSSGPVLAAGFWLREATGWDGFYAVLWLYYPLLALGHVQPLDAYISWWCRVFHTVGPG